MISNTILAWMAGFFDGEGTVSINKAAFRGEKTRHSPSYTLIVYVSNTKRESLEVFQSTFNGRLQTVSRLWRGENWATAYKWYLHSEKAYDFLRLLLPYLVLKKTHAEEGIAFQEHKSFIRANNVFGYNKTLSQEEISFREVYYQKFRVLNSKGRIKKTLQQSLS